MPSPRRAPRATEGPWDRPLIRPGWPDSVLQSLDVAMRFSGQVGAGKVVVGLHLGQAAGRAFEFEGLFVAGVE